MESLEVKNKKMEEGKKEIKELKQKLDVAKKEKEKIKTKTVEVECNFRRRIAKGAYYAYECEDSDETHHHECSCAAGPHFQMDCAEEKCIFQQQIKLLKEILECVEPAILPHTPGRRRY